jgi:thiol:disulfide interchange protein DsbD
MAAPYVVLSALPSLLKFVPKPGRWMETLKQFMGFLLLGTVIWLAWVLQIQTGSDSLIMLMGALLLLGIGAWVYGRWGSVASGRNTRLRAALVASILLIGGLGTGLASAGLSSEHAGKTAESVQGNLTWEAYTPDRVEELLAQGRPLLIDFTAAWCLSCQVNERVAFGSEEVQQRIADLNVATIKADWTSRDPAITLALASFGRNSVPLYVLYSGRADEEPIILPEILTPGIVLDALNKIKSSQTS